MSSIIFRSILYPYVKLLLVGFPFFLETHSSWVWRWNSNLSIILLKCHSNSVISSVYYPCFWKIKKCFIFLSICSLLCLFLLSSVWPRIRSCCRYMSSIVNTFIKRLRNQLWHVRSLWESRVVQVSNDANDTESYLRSE